MFRTRFPRAFKCGVQNAECRMQKQRKRFNPGSAFAPSFGGTGGSIWTLPPALRWRFGCGYVVSFDTSIEYVEKTAFYRHVIGIEEPWLRKRSLAKIKKLADGS